MPVKLILLDLDGTLLTSGKTISPANYAALERCSSAGIHIVPSTGRFYGGMPQAVRELPFVRYVVTVNGAQVYDAREDRVLCREEIAPADALRIYGELDTLPVIYDCFLDGWGYMDERMYAQIDQFISDPGTNRMVKELRKPVRDFKRFIARENRPLQKLQMFFADMDRRAAELERLPRLFPDMAVSSSIANNIEFNAKRANKGEALRFLCHYLGLSVQETMSFGDSGNDLSMIAAAGVGVAMANADQALLDAADYVTDTNDNDGVAKAIKAMVSQVKEQYPNAQLFGTTLRQAVSANEHLWGALLLSDSGWAVEEPRPIPVMDRIGGGDGFYDEAGKYRAAKAGVPGPHGRAHRHPWGEGRPPRREPVRR